MWIVDALFIIVAAALASALLWTPMLWFGLFPLLALLILGIDRLGSRHIPRWCLPAALVPLIIVWAWAMSAPIEPSLRYPVLILALALMVLWLVLFRGRFLALLPVVVPSLLSLIWLSVAQVTEQQVAAAQLGLWAMAIWPFISFINRPRHLLGFLAMGPLILVMAVQVMIRQLQANPSTLWDIAAAVPENLLTQSTVAAQATLFFVIIIPLAVHASFRWVFTVVLGFGLSLAIYAMATLVTVGGPWPALIQIVMFGAALVLCLGCAGVLASAKRAGALATVASRTLSLGCMATAVQCAILLVAPASAQSFVQVSAAALAPAMAGIILAGIVFIAAMVPMGDAGSQRLRTKQLLRAWGQQRRELLISMKHGLKAGWLTTLNDVRNLGDPWRLAPLLIFAAAWPAISLLDEGLWLLLPYLLGYVISSWSARFSLLWLALFQLMIAAAAYGIGNDIALLPLFGTVALLAAWPFNHWPRLNASFAYPFALVLLAPIWLVTASADATQVVLGTGLVILLANALRRGPMRWVLLGAGLILIAPWMGNWLLNRDPFTTIILLQNVSFSYELALMVLHIPFVVLLLLVMWISRLRGANWWLVMGNRDLLAIALGGVAVGFWVYGLREHLIPALLALIALALLAPSITRELKLTQITGYRHPLTTTLAIALMLLLLSLATAIHLLPQQGAPSTLRVQQAGTLGPLYLQIIREMVSCMFALLVVITWHLSCRHGADIAVLATSTIARRKPIGMKAKPKGISLARRLYQPLRALAMALVWRLGDPLWRALQRVVQMLRRWLPGAKKNAAEQPEQPSQV